MPAARQIATATIDTSEPNAPPVISGSPPNRSRADRGLASGDGYIQSLDSSRAAIIEIAILSAAIGTTATRRRAPE